MEKARIGFVGVGAMGQMAHLRNYVNVGECQVVAIAEINQEQAEKVSARYGIPKIYKNHLAMLEAEKLDGIVASQPFTRHGILLKDIFTAKVPVITEKPLARCVEVGEEILKAAKANGVAYYVGYHKRSDPATMFAKAEIEKLKESGELGKLKYIRIIMPPGDWVASGFEGMIMTQRVAGLDQDPVASDMDDPTFQQYGAFVNYYIHQVNLLRHLFGEDYQVSYADPNSVLLVAHSASGVTGSIEMAPYSNTIDWQEEALVCFDKGFIRLNLPAPLAYNRCGKVAIYKDPGQGATPVEIHPQLPWVHAFKQQAKNFVAAIKGEKTCLCGPEDALKDLEVAKDFIRMKNA